MFSIFKRRAPVTAHVNGTPVPVGSGETLLQAALRSGIDFPHSCRVGGCASCKCRLTSGRVRELTPSGYVLSEDELDQGYILACQSVPSSDIAVEVDLSAAPARRRVPGRVIGQQRLTHDITALRIQLSESLHYKAGQFANLRLAPLGDHARSYSFATDVQPDGQVQFFVRKVPGGALSMLVNEASLVGTEATVEGPLGEFWLRPADAPLLFIAGGSGLAPILAMLGQAARSGCGRPVTLLFGARGERDLYGLEAIQDIARHWPAQFSFLPVLSGPPDADGWQGARGMVGDHLARHVAGDAHAYLCGPPVMVDACTATLTHCGVAREHIFADRFTTIRGQQ
ncbi:2Fe-2S iron-sulfur cluster binding domain-containing protein [Duganella sp. FT3S]|uniref:2Fe-2S iron-sulfur cluster binding domain-containing protein n=1 Tax=Rugamonas fusca TaxID=2758568 RepID=A0A7W2EDQ6_9BURK|nr:2Fe-2S iron-sulfur cluster binding domain-containing protein [Rugamonas fusca]MBA5604063.1 2Fe-2S iron-sulfur cluster binding domain-containing protein [Rugamonas fusca]